MTRGERPGGITPEHIRAIWHIASIPGHPNQQAHQDEALRLANLDHHQAVEYIMGHHPVEISASAASVGDRRQFLRDMRELIAGYLDAPDTLPKGYKVPTLEDCQRLAQDLENSEAARCLAWLLGQWPTRPNHIPSPTMIGDATDEPGAMWVFLMGDHISVHTRLEKHPHAEKQVFQFQHQAHPSQLVGTARWLLAQAGAQA